MSKKKTQAAKPAGDKLNYGRTTMIGFGFMSCMLLWSVYNSYVPVILKGKLSQIFADGGAVSSFIDSHSWLVWLTVPLLVNAIMTIDNIFGVIFQPYFGKKSDHTHTKFGKRMPYIIICLPICAVFFSLIPVAATVKSAALSILLMMTVIIFFNFTMSIWRSPVVSLMPDFTPSHLQSDANAVINIMGGIGQMVGFVVGTIASAVIGLLGFTTLSENLKASKNELGEIINKETGELILDASGNPQYVNYTPVFVVTAVIALLCLVILVVFYKRNKQYDLSAEVGFEKGDEEVKKEKIKIKNLPISKEEKRSLITMLLALFLINNATEAIVPNFTNFAEVTLKVPTIYSTLMMAVFAVSLAVFGIPAGMMGRKIGRKKTIIIGLSGIVAMFAVYLTVSQIVPQNADGTANTFTWVILWIALVVGGACIGCVNINTLPLVLAIGGREYVGTFTGYYYTATFSAAVTGPILCGLVIGLFKEDYNFMFLFCAVMFALGLAVITQVKHGEISKDEDTAWLDEAVENADD
ncbi:MAG: MFS transporter [Acutalibacteraceae bacterium]